MKASSAVLLAGLVAATGCGRTTQDCDLCGDTPSASAGGSAAGSGGSTVLGAGTAGVAQGGQIAWAICQPGAPSSPLTRYSTLELEWTLADILGKGPGFSQETTDLPAEIQLPAYRDVSSRFATGLAEVALARAAVAEIGEDQLMVCEADIAEPEREGCVDSWIRERGLRLYRRPLSDAQLDGYLVQFSEQSRLGSPLAAARSVLVSMMLSPYFVFRVELGATSFQALGASPPTNSPLPPEFPEGTELSSFEIAARLSHFATRSAPDPELLASAARDELRSPDNRIAELGRLQATPQGQRARLLQHLEWLGPGQFSGAEVDDDQELADAMLAQTTAFIAQVLGQPQALLTELLTATRQPLNQRLADHYGISAKLGEAFEPVDLDANFYAGVLSQGAFLTRHATPTRRGVFVWRRLLCVDPPPPPPTPFTELDFTGNTPRERILSVTSGQPCAVCHTMFDPPGFALEAFDDRGRLTGFDTTGTLWLPSTQQQIPVGNPGALGRAIAESPDARECAAQRYYEQLVDQPAYAEIDKAWVHCLAGGFVDGGLDLNQLARALIASNVAARMVRDASPVVGASSSPGPVEHALEEATELLGAFTGEEDLHLLEQYVAALRELQQLGPIP